MSFKNFDASDLNTDQNDHGAKFPSISEANDNQLEKYRYKAGKSSYWLSEEDIRVATLPLSKYDGVYSRKESDGFMPIHILGINASDGKSQFNQDNENTLRQDFAKSHKKLFFIFEQTNEGGGHWLLHSYMKDNEGEIKKLYYDKLGNEQKSLLRGDDKTRASYNPPLDGMCGDRAIAMAYRITRQFTNIPPNEENFNLYIDPPNKGAVREQTIHFIRHSELKRDNHYSNHIKTNQLFIDKNKEHVDEKVLDKLSDTLSSILQDDGYNQSEDYGKNLKAWRIAQTSLFNHYNKHPVFKAESDSSDNADNDDEKEALGPSSLKPM